MSSLPLNRILELRKQFHQNVSKVYANKIQCERLCQRIDQLIDPLERLEHASSTILRDETRPILDQFLHCIEECNAYIEKFQSADHWYEEIVDYKKSEEKFRELNQCLSQLGEDLSLGLNIQQLFDRKQDQEDQREDFQDLTQKLDQIAQKMLDKQCEQYHLIDKMIDRRLLSFRLYLAQNLSLQSTDNSSARHEQFLHIPYKDLYLHDCLLGSGGFADVYKATWLTHHDQVAVKIIRLNSISNIQNDFDREISMMYRIRYENVLSVLGACVEPNFYAIVIEYMPLGSLADILYKNKHAEITFDWSDRYSIAWQMAKSINYLHQFKPSILHRDIKSMNFLLKSMGSFNPKYLVKVCDFGLAEIRKETFTQSASFPSIQIVGSFYWKAPELFTSPSRHTKESDVYSLGIVFWELATGRKPWNEYEDETILFIQMKIGERPTIPSDIPNEYQQLIRDAWNHDPQKRPSCFQLMERVSQIINSTIEESNAVDDVHSQIINTDPCQSVSSTTNSDSTRTAIEVVEEKNEEQKLIDSLPSIIISQLLPSKVTTDQSESESTIKHSASCSSLHHGEHQPQTTLPFIPTFERTLSKSVEDITANTKAENEAPHPANPPYFPIYKLEKRRPLHGKSIWTEKKK